jgi:hypothetical protein
MNWTTIGFALSNVRDITTDKRIEIKKQVELSNTIIFLFITKYSLSFFFTDKNIVIF